MPEAATLIDSATEKPIKMLTLTEKLGVQYCIPSWLRDEQIKLNCQRITSLIEAGHEKRSEPIAVVNFGPSLRDTWEDIRKFKYVMSCSGAHRFLIERGIVPTYHIDVDPRPHKIKLLGEPHPDVEYLIASTCHPDLFEHLKGFKIKMWHIFDTSDDGLRLLPHGQWAITGGCSVGVRTLTISRFLGFTEIHVFGMDGSFAEEGTHAAEHPNSPKSYSLVEYPEGSGRTYRTTPAMLEAARNTWHELDMMKDTKVVFYGDGLVQSMAYDYVRKSPSADTFIGFNKPELISAEYRDLNRRLHEDNLAYGVGGGKHADTVLKIARNIGTNSILDYGCGKGYLQKALPFPIWEYDPAVPGKQESPRPADLVVCTDVLEHIEPEKLNFVLDDLARCVLKVGYFVIHTVAAQKTLADGRNTHLILHRAGWWKKQLKRFFVVAKLIDKGREIHIVVAPRAKKAARAA